MFFLKLGPRRQEFPFAVLLPNMLTTLALCCGLAAIHFATRPDLAHPEALRPDWNKALAAVVLAGVFDALDGRAARLLRVTSGFGAILDSLSDFLAFGVAPAVILHQWLAFEGELSRHAANGEATRSVLAILALAAFLIYALGAALRLARFTAEAPASKTKAHSEVAPFFKGMPSPAAAGIVLVPAFLAQSKYVGWSMPPLAVIILALVIGLLMISRVPMFSLKSLKVSRRVVAPVLVGVGLLAAAMVIDPFLTLAGLGILYALSVPITAVRWWRWHPVAPAHEPPATEQPAAL